MNEKRKHIIDTAIRLFLEEGTSVATAKIAKEAGISNGTLFNYFKTKQTLIDETYLDIKKERAERFDFSISSNQGSLRESLYAFWKDYFAWAQENPHKHQVVLLLRNSNVISQQAIEQSQDLFACSFKLMQSGVEHGIIRDVPQDYNCMHMSSSLSTAIRYADQAELQGKELDDLIDLSFTLMFDGLSH